MMRSVAVAGMMRNRVARFQVKGFASMVERKGPPALTSGTFAGKNVVVTGGGSGFGEAFTRSLGAQGARVLVVDRDIAAADKVATETPGALSAKIDVTDNAQVEALFKDATAAFDGRLDIVFNNAGIVTPPVPTHQRPIEMWNSVINVNLTGVFYVLRSAVAQMVAQKPQGGIIINTASIAGIEAIPWLPIEYTCSKHAVVAMTKQAAVEYAKQGIRVCAIAPTFVGTPLVQEFAKHMEPDMLAAAGQFNPMPDGPTPQDVANAGLFLCSDNARYISGSTIAVDGAYCAGSSSPSAR